VKQAQKDGAGVGDISAGLSTSVVKNAIYKVIRASDADELGHHIVVQGGTFYNDAVLRAFEKEIGRDVVRPSIAGLMGAYGAALYARSMNLESSTLISKDALESFTHTSKAATCHGCTNNCRLTVNTFNGKEKYISGNKCDRGSGLEDIADKLDIVPNLHRFKREKFESLMNDVGEDTLENGKTCRGTVGLPLALGMYELGVLWHTLFRSLGFKVVFSGFSNRKIYTKGQYSIPSDTACYPAKIMHGHMESLVEKGVDFIFYPSLTYNVDEKISDNHYNCPVVAYYSELLAGNMESLRHVNFLYPYLNINSKSELTREMWSVLRGIGDIKRSEIKDAVNKAFDAYDSWMKEIRLEGDRAVTWARERGKRIMILAGRPYHIDPEIGHGIDRLAANLGFVVVTEDAVDLSDIHPSVAVLNQWTYHARLYASAIYASQNSDVELVQLVSFGCGIDAITTDEVRAILEKNGKLYTQIKIDEITNLGAVNIRLRSLLGALDFSIDE
jgi:predicted nucleotide-binding protein (sugar kinase/HSP70/actin superfamily)